MRPDLILAADFGTSAVKVGAVGRDLAAHSKVQRARERSEQAGKESKRSSKDVQSARPVRVSRKLVLRQPYTNIYYKK